MKKDAGSIPMDEPLAYFLTWTTYGSWMPGDKRGWVEKRGQFRAPDAVRKAAAQELMTEGALTLDNEQRFTVEGTIGKHCQVRDCYLHAVSCRTQHVHVVVTAPKRHPDVVMDQFKAWCTRRLKELQRAHGEAEKSIRQNWWTQRGSKQWLNDQASLEAAIRYVVEEQGAPTPRPEKEEGPRKG